MVASKSQQIKDLLNRIIDGASTSLNKRKHEYLYCQNFILLFFVLFDNFSGFPETTFSINVLKPCNVLTENIFRSNLIREHARFLELKLNPLEQKALNQNATNFLWRLLCLFIK